MRRAVRVAALLALAWGLVPSAGAAKKWRVKENCTLIENEANDGDSFHVKVGNRHYIFRLLWVDAPETDKRFPERVAEQAEYFGITPEQAIEVGKQARKFSADFLNKPFTVYTQFDDAMGASAKDRDYAILQSGETYLMEALISNGLARLHGIQEMPEDGPSVNRMRGRLKGLENEAQKNRRGAWGLAPGGDRFARLNQVRDIPTQERVVGITTQVFDPADPTRILGVLTAGRAITVLRAESPTMVRIRILLPDGRTIEGLCRRTDLNL